MFSVTDSSAKNIYSRMFDYYAGQQMPSDSNGVFFGFENYTKDKLIYTIETMKKNYGLGWYSSDFSARSSAIEKITDALYKAFDFSVDRDGIKKFCNWVYAWAVKDSTAIDYFTGKSGYSALDELWKDITETVSDKVSSVVETVNYGVQYPSLDVLAPSKSSLIKWVVILGSGYILLSAITNKLLK